MASLKIYNVYIKNDGGSVEDVLFVKEGFSLLAFLLHMVWACYYRIWWLAALVFAFYSVVYALDENGVLNQASSTIIELGFLCWVGFNAHDWLGLSLRKRGYALIDIVSAPSRALAQQRFYDRYLPYTSRVPV